MLTVSTEERITVEEALNHRYSHIDDDDDDEGGDDDSDDDDVDVEMWLFSFSAFYYLCGSLSIPRFGIATPPRGKQFSPSCR